MFIIVLMLHCHRWSCRPAWRGTGQDLAFIELRWCDWLWRGAGASAQGSGEGHGLADGAEGDAGGGGGPCGSEDAVDGRGGGFLVEVDGLEMDGEDDVGAGVAGCLPALFGSGGTDGHEGEFGFADVTFAELDDS